MAEIISAGDFATEGERRAAATLRQLPDHWVVICNKTLPTSGGRSYEIDFIILASRHVFVLDEKSWRGRIVGSDQEWVRSDGSSQRSPLNKIEAVARVLAGHLRSRVSALRNERAPFVHGGVLLSFSERMPTIRDPRATDGIFPLPKVCDRLVALDRTGGSTTTGAQRDTIRHCLLDLSDRPQIPSTIGIFTIEEAMSGRPGSRVFQAKTPTGDACTLMAYDLGRDPLAAQELQAFYMREYTTLQTLRDTRLVPEVGTPFHWSDDFLIVPILPLPGKALGAFPILQG